MPCTHFYVYIFTFLYEYCTLSQTVTYIIIFSIWIRETRFVGNDRKNEKTRFIVFFSTNIVKFDDIFFFSSSIFIRWCNVWLLRVFDKTSSFRDKIHFPARHDISQRSRNCWHSNTRDEHVSFTDTINRTASWDHSNVCGGTIVRYKLLEIIRRSCFINDSSV